MIKNVRVENGWIFIERENDLQTSISLNSPTGNGQLERWDNNYVYVRTNGFRLIYGETGEHVRSESI